MMTINIKMQPADGVADTAKVRRCWPWRGPYAIHRPHDNMPGVWCVTHVQSGRRLASFSCRRHARLAIKAVTALNPDWLGPTAEDDPTVIAAKGFVVELATECDLHCESGFGAAARALLARLQGAA